MRLDKQLQLMGFSLEPYTGCYHRLYKGEYQLVHVGFSLQLNKGNDWYTMSSWNELLSHINHRPHSIFTFIRQIDADLAA